MYPNCICDSTFLSHHHLQRPLVNNGLLFWHLNRHVCVFQSWGANPCARFWEGRWSSSSLLREELSIFVKSMPSDLDLKRPEEQGPKDFLLCCSCSLPSVGSDRVVTTEHPALRGKRRERCFQEGAEEPWSSRLVLLLWLMSNTSIFLSVVASTVALHPTFFRSLFPSTPLPICLLRCLFIFLSFLLLGLGKEGKVDFGRPTCISTDVILPWGLHKLSSGDVCRSSPGGRRPASWDLCASTSTARLWWYPPCCCWCWHYGCWLLLWLLLLLEIVLF